MPAKRDDLLTLTAIGVLAYLVADLSHHLLGHGAACLAASGKILRLSSIVLKCSAESPFIDLGGPAANFALGSLAVGCLALGVRGTLKLLLVLIAAFNLFWFAGQMVFSVASGTDDWAWPMSHFHLNQAGRALLMATGVGLYIAVIRLLATELADFSGSRDRIARVCRSAWFAAAGVAAVTALFDVNPLEVLWKHALPQGLLAPLGLLLVPARAVQHDQLSAAAIQRSWPWTAAAVCGFCASLGWLGHGVSFG